MSDERVKRKSEERFLSTKATKVGRIEFDLICKNVIQTMRESSWENVKATVGLRGRRERERERLTTFPNYN
jgi:hypothetical protein